jgi:hypothetical protein
MEKAPTTELLSMLRTALSAKFPPSKIDEIFLYYSLLKKEARLDHYDNTLVNSGKFVEAVLKCLHYLATEDEVDTVTVGQEINQLERVTTLNDSEKMTIPRTLRIIYEHRNRRGGAHNHSFDPQKMDCVLVVAASTWVMEELTRLYLTNEPTAAQALVANLLVKEIPFIEEIDGDYIVSRPELSATTQLGMLLYYHFPNRCQISDLIQWLQHIHSASNIRTSLRRMQKDNLVHENEIGWKLTEAGVQKTEQAIAKLQDQENGALKIKKGSRKGVKYARHRIGANRAVHN